MNHPHPAMISNLSGIPTGIPTGAISTGGISTGGRPNSHFPRDHLSAQASARHHYALYNATDSAYQYANQFYSNGAMMAEDHYSVVS